MKHYYSLALASMLALTATAANDHTLDQVRLNESIKAFLATPMGQHFTYEEVLQAYRAGNVPVLQAGEITRRDNVLTETFAGLTKGSEETPDTDDLGLWEQEAVDAVLDNPGWTTYLTFAAGGCAYLGVNPEDSSDPGYLMTPNKNTTDGIYALRLRVRNVNPNGNGYPLQYFVMHNPESDDDKHMISANYVSISNEWSEVEFEIGQCTEETSVMFFSWKGMILVDDVCLDKVIYALETPQNVSCTLTSIGHVDVKWDAVPSATSYTVSFYTSGSKFIQEETTTTNSLSAAVDFDPTDGLIIEVTPSNEEGSGHASRNYFDNFAPSSLDAPVALAATHVSSTGFTLNWEPVSMAYNYEIRAQYAHTALADGEEYYYMDEDFSEVKADLDSPESTVISQSGRPVSLDEYIGTPGWSAYLASVATGQIGITNVYKVLPAILIGPSDDYSLGGGKVTISGRAMSVTDDAIVTVGFGKKSFLGSYSFTGTTQTIDLAPNEMADFEVTLTGGTKGSFILIKLTDATDEGDMACFSQLQIKTALSAGESYVQQKAVVRVPYTETSYDVAMPFYVGDEYAYTVTSAFGDVKSVESNVVTVKLEETAIESVEAAPADATYYTLDGRQAQGQRGLGIVRKGNKAQIILM